MQVRLRTEQYPLSWRVLRQNSSQTMQKGKAVKFSETHSSSRFTNVFCFLFAISIQTSIASAQQSWTSCRHFQPGTPEIQFSSSHHLCCFHLLTTQPPLQPFHQPAISSPSSPWNYPPCTCQEQVKQEVNKSNLTCASEPVRVKAPVFSSSLTIHLSLSSLSPPLRVIKNNKYNESCRLQNH